MSEMKDAGQQCAPFCPDPINVKIDELQKQADEAKYKAAQEALINAELQKDATALAADTKQFAESVRAYTDGYEVLLKERESYSKLAEHSKKEAERQLNDAIRQAVQDCWSKISKWFQGAELALRKLRDDAEMARKEFELADWQYVSASRILTDLRNYRTTQEARLKSLKAFAEQLKATNTQPAKLLYAELLLEELQRDKNPPPKPVYDKAGEKKQGNEKADCPPPEQPLPNPLTPQQFRSQIKTAHDEVLAAREARRTAYLKYQALKAKADVADKTWQAILERRLRDLKAVADKASATLPGKSPVATVPMLMN